MEHPISLLASVLENLAPMPTAQQTLAPLTFWKLFHNTLSHGVTEEETARSREAWVWVLSNLTTLRKVSIDNELELLNIIWVLGSDLQQLPSYDLVKDKVKDRSEAEARGITDLLIEYEELREDLSLFSAKELPVLLKDHVHEFGKLKLGALLQASRTILEGHEEVRVGKRTFKGLEDAVTYLMAGIERGVIVTNTQDSTGPIVVNNTATEVVDHYYEMLRQGVVPSGFTEFDFEQTDFIGVLGYANHGKSPLCRHIVYQMALAGKRILHITLEDDKRKERSKYVVLHSHHPKFQGRCAELSWEHFRKRCLSQKQLQMLQEASDDFAQTVEGNIVIDQPEANWEACKQAIRNANQTAPLDGVLIDYLQLIDPPTTSGDDQRSKMTAMIKDARQFCLHFSPDGTRKRLILISPIQANEAGLADAEANGGEWKPTGINNDKELLRSMTMIIGVYKDGPSANLPGGIDIKVSKVKVRDGGEFGTFLASIDCAGWVSTGATAMVKEIKASEYIDAI